MNVIQTAVQCDRNRNRQWKLLSLVTPAHAVLYLSTHAFSVLCFMPCYSAPPLRAHQGRTAGGTRERMLPRRLCCFLIMYEGWSFNSINFCPSLNLQVKYKCPGVFRLLLLLFFLDAFKGMFWVQYKSSSINSIHVDHHKINFHSSFVFFEKAKMRHCVNVKIVAVLNNKATKSKHYVLK